MAGNLRVKVFDILTNNSELNMAIPDPIASIQPSNLLETKADSLSHNLMSSSYLDLLQVKIP